MDDHLRITGWLAEYTLHQNLHRYLTDWPNLDDEKFDSDIQRLEILYFQSGRDDGDSRSSHILRLLLVSKHMCTTEDYLTDTLAALESIQGLIESLQYFLADTNKETITTAAQQCLFEANYLICELAAYFTTKLTTQDNTDTVELTNLKKTVTEGHSELKRLMKLRTDEHQQAKEKRCRTILSQPDISPNISMKPLDTYLYRLIQALFKDLRRPLFLQMAMKTMATGDKLSSNIKEQSQVVTEQNKSNASRRKRNRKKSTATPERQTNNDSDDSPTSQISCSLDKESRTLSNVAYESPRSSSATQSPISSMTHSPSTENTQSPTTSPINHSPASRDTPSPTSPTTHTPNPVFASTATDDHNPEATGAPQTSEEAAESSMEESEAGLPAPPSSVVTTSPPTGSVPQAATATASNTEISQKEHSGWLKKKKTTKSSKGRQASAPSLAASASSSRPADSTMRLEDDVTTPPGTPLLPLSERVNKSIVKRMDRLQSELKKKKFPTFKIRPPSHDTGVRGRWLADEEEEFIMAVLKLGEGNWTQIKDKLLSRRSTVQMKDKWKSLQLHRKQQLMDMAREHGLRYICTV